MRSGLFFEKKRRKISSIPHPIKLPAKNKNVITRKNFISLNIRHWLLKSTDYQWLSMFHTCFCTGLQCQKTPYMRCRSAKHQKKALTVSQRKTSLFLRPNLTMWQEGMTVTVKKLCFLLSGVWVGLRVKSRGNEQICLKRTYKSRQTA